MRSISSACLSIACALTQQSLAVDLRPLEVEAVLAFPSLEWPDWVLGLDGGKYQPARPVIITGAGDGSNRLFTVSEYGTIHVFPNDPEVQEMELFLDLRDRVQFDPKYTEEGLLGLAFHPRFKENGEFFVYYSAKPTKESKHTSIISRFHVDPTNANLGDPTSEEILLRIEQPYWNHNGGTVIFGPDGCFYIVLGDGGKGGDPHRNGQNLGTLFGSILRIDVDSRDEGLNYAIPKDNPFVGKRGARGEIWAYGLRNVWRMSFDRETHVCWAADVGQNKYEEINLIVPGGNYGWNLCEGMHKYEDNGQASHRDLIDPIWEYDHEVGKSITGGCVYRGKAVPSLQGAYLYADYVTGKISALWYDHAEKKVAANRTIVESGMPVTTFGEDDAGEVYYATENGSIMRFTTPQAVNSLSGNTMGPKR
jgi:glucose/arabinose dehydrogenase